MLFGFSDEGDVPPAPLRSTVFVMRNGHYEPQNLMPMLPRPDVMDFNGFVARGPGAASGYMNARPPELKQASLQKNPVNVRRDSVHITSIAGKEGEARLSFVFDALRPVVISLRLMSNEVEQGEGLEKSIKLVPRRPEPDAHDGLMGSEEPEDVRPFEPGLGQLYESPPLDLERWPDGALAFDADRPRDVPVAVSLEVADADAKTVGSAAQGAAEGAERASEACTHYTYISLHRQPLSPAGNDEDDKRRAPQWSAQIFVQKLQYMGQCFMLHEVFGVTSNLAKAELDSGNSDCVICLSEPRDTAVLPCRHMCFCNYCAGIVRLQCDKCPVCRQKVVSLLHFKRDQDRRPEEMALLSPKTGAAAPLASVAVGGSTGLVAERESTDDDYASVDPFLLGQTARASTGH